MSTLIRTSQVPAADRLDFVREMTIRRHFAFPALGRVVLNNAASTQPRPAGSLAAVPVRRRHGRRGASVPRAGRVQRPAWKYAPGTPDILGAIVSAQVLRLLLDLALTPWRPAYYGTGRPPGPRGCARRHGPRRRLEPAADRPRPGRPRRRPGDHIYGPRDAARRTSLVAFNLAGRVLGDAYLSRPCRGLGVPDGCP